MRTRITAGAVLLWAVAACAAPTTRLAPVAKEEVAAEEAMVNQGVYCWGRNMWSSVGDGTLEDRLTPTRIVQ